MLSEFRQSNLVKRIPQVFFLLSFSPPPAKSTAAPPEGRSWSPGQRRKSEGRLDEPPHRQPHLEGELAQKNHKERSNKGREGKLRSRGQERNHVEVPNTCTSPEHQATTIYTPPPRQPSTIQHNTHVYTHTHTKCSSL